MTVFPLFRQCVEAIQNNVLISRVSDTDKEYHFQNWFRDRLAQTSYRFDANGRNSYPDFTMVATTEGYELKGLAYPGRVANFDSNSQVPTGLHNGRTVYYVFGRYPKKPDGSTYPVLDLVICHGDFLNADHDYEHKNKSVRGFGSYGDIMIRDRKMYVVPTPFHLVEGLAHTQTLILPAAMQPDGRGYQCVGELCRREADLLLTGYAFDLQTNALNPQTIPSPVAGREHHFRAWRLTGALAEAVTMRPQVVRVSAEDDDEDA